MSRSARCRLSLWPAALSGLLVAAAVLSCRVRGAEENAAIERRLADSARYLASDELEGRGLGTRGLDLAAEYVATHFSDAGLRPALPGGGLYQRFTVTTSAELGKNNAMALVGPPKKGGGAAQRIAWKLGDDFSPLAQSGSAKVDLPLVFVGYGITGKQEGYDDYAGIDVAGKAVVMLRHEPQQADPKSVFDGTKVSAYAPLRRKVSNAFEHSAAAVVFVTDQFEIGKNVARQRQRWQEALDRVAEEHAKFKRMESPSLEEIESQRRRIEELTRQVDLLGKRLQAAYDPVLTFSAAAAEGQPRDFPVIHCRRAVMDRVVRSALGTGLADLERRIDEGPTPHSRALDGWRMVGEVDVARTQSEVKNVVGVLPGRGPLAGQAVVVGAHYDHLGWGGPGSLEPGKKAIHNGADDNASGVAVLLEVARTLAAQQPTSRRRLVFVAFTGEEEGLLGSSYYVRHPVVPINQTVALVNMDMVGRLRDDKLIVSGAGTAEGFGDLLDEINRRYGFQLTKNPGGWGPSDHAAFYAKKIPVMHYFTGTHQHYHRPSDDFEFLNIAGMRRIAAMVTDVVAALAEAPERPHYVAVARPKGRGAGDRPYFGSIPDFAYQGPGYGLSGVAEGGPAARAGLQADDVIVRFGQSRIGNLEDFDSALRKYGGGDRVRVVVLRDGKEMTFEVTLEPPR